MSPWAGACNSGGVESREVPRLLQARKERKEGQIMAGFKRLALLGGCFCKAP